MISKIKKPVSILLALMMVVSLFTIVPMTASAETNDTITVFFSDAKNWGKVYVYGFDNDRHSITADYPGKEMNNLFTNDYNENVYGATIPASTTGIVFSDGSYINKTPDITLVVDGGWWYWKDASNAGWVGETIHAATPATETTPGNIKYYELDGYYYNDSLTSISEEKTVIPATGPAVTYVAQIGDTKYETLDAAIAAAQAGDTVKLLDTVTLTEALVIPEGKDFTLDLNGKDITGNVNDKLVQNNGTVVVDDSTAAPGHIYNTNIDKQGNAAFVNYSTATVKNGYFGDKNSDMTDANDVNRGAGFQNYGTAVIDGGYFTACDNFTNTEGTGSGYAYAIINYGTLTVNDATVYGKNNGNLANNEGTMTVNGGTYTLNKPAKKNVYYSIYNGSADANTIVNAGTFTNNGTKALLYTLEGSTEIKGGTFTGPKIEQSTGAPAISGGTFNKAVPEEYCVEGYLPVTNTDGTYTVGGPYVAKIGSTGYATLTEAIAAAQAGDTVKLLSNVSETVTISGKTLTLDLNGFNITSASKKMPITAIEGTKLTIINSNEDKAENTATQNAIMGPSGSNNQGSLNAKGEGTTVDIYAGYYYGYNGNKTAINAINGATVTFWGGTVNGAKGINDTTAGKEGKVFYSGVSNPTKPYATNPGYIVVHGGNFSGRMSDSNWGNYLIDGGTFDRNVVVLNENPVDADGNRVATATSSMTQIGTGTLYDAGWLADGYIPKDNGDGTYGVKTGAYVAQVNGVKYETLEAAFAAAQDGNTITLLANCAGNGIKVAQGKYPNGLTVDFGGYTYTVDGDTVGSTGTETNGFQLLKDNKITFRNGAITSTKAKILVQNYSNLMLDGMTLTLNNTGYNGAYTLSNNNGDVVINNTTIKANPAGGFAFDVCRFSSYKSVNVTVTGNSTINGNVEVSASNSAAKDGFSLTLESGTMTGDIVVDASAKNLINNGGTVNKAAAFNKAAPEGFVWVDSATTGVKTLAKAVAKIGTTNYATLEAAFAAAQDGETITLLANCAGNGIKVTPEGKFATGLTVDFAGHTYTVDGATVGSSGTETNGFQLLKDNTITFKNGTITSTKAKILVQNYSNLTLNNMTLTLNNPNYTSAYTLSNNNGDIVIDGTTINANPAGGFAFDVCRFSSYPSVNVTVTGNSKINGNVEVSASKSDPKDGFSLNLNGGTMTGAIVLAPSAKAAMEKAPDKVSVNKATTFDKAAPEGYKWVDKDGKQTLAKIEDLFVAHSITLDGNIKLNFFINPEFANFANASSAKVKFSWDGNTAEVNLKTAAFSEDGWYKASVELVAAEMANVVHAEVYLGNEKIGEDNYTVREYAEKLYKNPGAYDKKNKPEKLRALAKALLNYGAMAQTVFVGDFTVRPEDFANANLDENDKTAYASVTAEDIRDAIPEQASNMEQIGTQLGGKFYTSSVIYLNQNKLRLYFTPKSYPGTLEHRTQYSGVVEEYYYYVDSQPIPAAELDQQQHFKIGNVEFNYSALDYAKAVVENNKSTEAVNLAKALFCYYQAAKAYC